MPGMTDITERAVLRHLFMSTSLARLTNVFISLHTADPGDSLATNTATPTEINVGGYARVSVSVADASWAESAVGESSVITNRADIRFPVPTANWGSTANPATASAGASITHFGVWDALTGGTLLWTGTIGGGVGRPVNNGDGAPTFQAGALSLFLG